MNEKSQGLNWISGNDFSRVGALNVDVARDIIHSVLFDSIARAGGPRLNETKEDVG